MSVDRGAADSLTVRARELWEFLAGTGARFGVPVRVTVAPESQLCSPGWAGIVVIGGAALVTAPNEETAGLIESALGGLAPDAFASGGLLRQRLPIAEIRGPATLAYLDPADFRPRAAATTPLNLDDPGLQAFLQAAETADLEESGLREITTLAFTVRQHGQVVAAAGYQDWPGGAAQLSVLTAAAARGRGLAQAAASAAVAHAITAGKLPQWRARAEASRRVARTLGFRELGAQVSIRLSAATALPGR